MVGSNKQKRFIGKLHLTLEHLKIASIRKEIAILVNEQGVCIQEARKQMNIKYGKDWRSL